jgi:2-polyprenyl-3-methyl-5-hydroxy-6-metoxy-1,4-benzoquinol methylase
VPVRSCRRMRCGSRTRTGMLCASTRKARQVRLMFTDRVRAAFEVDETIVSALTDIGLSPLVTSQERYRVWRQSLDAERHTVVEYLLPRIVPEIKRESPPFMVQRGHLDLSREALKRRIDELRPWSEPYRIGHGLQTRDDFGWRMKRDRMLFRRDLITGTVATLLGDDLGETTVLDLGCGNGFFSLDIATRGAKHVDGLDLRPENIARAQFLAEHYGVRNVTFEARDAEAISSDRQWDVVLNLGVLYHVTQPLQFIRQSYNLCRAFALIDTVCHTEPVSAYMLFGDKDVGSSAEGRETFEFHPTYRGAIDTMRYAGFSEVIEVVGTAEPRHELYATGTRRCFLAFK